MSVRDIILAASGVSSAPPATTDPQFPNVSMLLAGDGTNGKQNNTFLDSSSNNFTITRNGNTTQGSVTPFGNNWSNYFDGAGDYLTTPMNTAFDFGTGDFTIESWIYTSVSTGIKAIVDTRDGDVLGAYMLNINAQKVDFIYSSSRVTSAANIPLNSWVHVAVTRASGTIRIFINGVVDTNTATYSSAINPLSNPSIGGGRSTSGNFVDGYYLTGYISNLRIVKGTAVYTSTFTPPTAPLTAITNTSLLTCQSNTFKDNSSNNFTITRNGNITVQSFSPFSPTASYNSSTDGASGYFDGSGDYLTTPMNTAFDFGSGNFTLEGWVYITSQPSNYKFIMGRWGGVGNTNSFNINLHSSTTRISVSLNGIGTTTGTTNLGLNSWNHFAVVRNGTDNRLYVNGVSEGFITSSATMVTGVGDVTIGRNLDDSNQDFPGYISNLRIVKGTAVYTANFTPSTTPLTAITNTSLLCNFTNAGIIDNAELNNLETVGNAQISTTQSKFGGSSMYFDGTGDWLTYNNTFTTQLQSGNFTIEGWLYLSTTGTAKYICAKGTSTTGWAFGVNASNQLIFNYTSTNLTATTALSSGIWYHVAVVRNGTATGNLKIYLNGTLDATSGVAVTTNFNQTNIGYIGADRTATNPMNGYIDDLRITKGIARYTANFTPPTAAFPTN